MTEATGGTQPGARAPAASRESTTNRALASGVPVVGFAAGCTPDVIVDGHNGLLVEHGDGSGLVYALSTLADPELRERLAGNARDPVTDRGWDVATADLMRHLPALV